MLDQQLYLWCALWLVAVGVIVFMQRRSAISSGLMLGYALNMFVLHWIGAAIYMLPWYWNSDLGIVLDGLRQSTFAMAGLAAGSVPVILAMQDRVAPTPQHQASAVEARVIRSCIAAGVISYFVLLPVLGQVPTLAAVISVGAGLVVVGLCLGCWNAYRRHNGMLIRWMLITAAMPVLTLLLQGFLSFGAAAMLAVFVFVASFYRPRWHVAAFALFITFLGLSVYVTYMRDRREIRAAVWGGESMSTRIGQTVATFSDPEFFDIRDIDHLRRVDVRLNQDFLVGAAVAWLRTRDNLFAHGETILDAFAAPIPRVLWPDKPIFAGSGDLVTRFTGIRFPEGTSVGIGQVMEFYVNFGSTGVFLGFVCFGALIAYVDARAANARDTGDWPQFVIWFLPGLSLLQSGGSLVEVTSQAAAALVVAYVFNYFNPTRPIVLPPANRRRILMRATRNRRVPSAEAPL
jgi:hypothetical protein